MYQNQGVHFPPPPGQGPPLPPRPASMQNPNQANSYYQPGYFANHSRGSTDFQAFRPPPIPPPLPPRETHPDYRPQRDQQQPNSYRPAIDLTYSLVSGFEQMSMGESGSHYTVAPDHPSSNVNHKDKIMPLPLLRENGEPNDIIYECPEGRTLDYETFWYHLKGISDFLVCTRCHDTHIARTSLISVFQKVRRPTGRCWFNVPRITEVLIPDASETGDLNALSYHMSHRLRIKDCQGEQGATSEDGLRWFVPASGEIEDFMACEACYEDVIKTTSFSTRFVPHNGGPSPGTTWLCDLSIPFIKRSLLEYSKYSQGWNEWVAVATRRVRLPACVGKAVEKNSIQWLRPRRQVEDIVICEACYLDQIALTAIDQHFEFVSQQQQQQQQQQKKPSIRRQLMGLLADDAEQAMWVCDNKYSVALSVAVEIAVKRQDFNVFYNAARAIVANPRCTASGITGGTWYTLAGGGCPEFQVCAGCYGTLYVPLNLGRFLERAAHSSNGGPGGQAVLCSYHPTHRNFPSLILRHEEAIDTGVWSAFSSHVRTWSSVQPCPREKLVPNRRWYGYGDLVICPSCWLSFCQSLAVLSIQPGLNVPIKNEMIQSLCMCSLYSPRMRQKWKEACAAGSASNILAFSRLRMEVYAETVLQIKTMESMKLTQARQAMNDANLSLVYKGIGGRRALMGTTDGYWHGNSRVGWHETEESATSPALYMRMQSRLRNASNMGDHMTIARMRLRWAEVE